MSTNIWLVFRDIKSYSQPLMGLMKTNFVTRKFSDYGKKEQSFCNHHVLAHCSWIFTRCQKHKITAIRIDVLILKEFSMACPLEMQRMIVFITYRRSVCRILYE